MEDSTGAKKISKKDRKHRRVKNQCVDRLKEYFQIVTGIELPEGCWEEVIQLVWGKIFDAGKLEIQVRVSVTLEEYAAKAGKIVKSMRTAVEKEKVKLDVLESLMQPLQQQILNLDYPQQGVCSDVIQGQGLEKGTTKASLQQPEYAANIEQIIKSQTLVETAGLELEKLALSMEQYLLNQDYPNCHKQNGVCSEVVSAPPDSIQSRTNAEVQKLFGHTVNTEFSVLQDLKVPNQCSVVNQFSSPNDEPQETKPNTSKDQHRMRKKQGHIALKVFFYMYTEIVLPKKWKKAEEFVEKKINDAKREGEKVKTMRRPPKSAAEVERTVESTQAAFKDAKMQVNSCKNLLQLVKQMFQNQVYPDCHEQHGVSSEVVIPDKEAQALAFNYLLPAGFIEMGQSSRIYKQKWNDMVLGDVQDPPESGQMLESWKATGCSNGTNSLVAPEAAVNLSSMGNFQGCGELRDSESLLKEIMKQFPQIAEGGFIEVLLEMAKCIPQKLELKDSNQELNPMDMRILQLKEKVDKTCQEVGALRQNKSKFNQRTKVQTKGKRKRSG
ncbi:uncharacterized protein LOC110417371 isoform X2 [Herrania umbratica]|uniref:Uncharacterized protein LOC110417371 isoform X2 n=1 Tax=Herrania umbratica TaxID=108875 RepID=A0A6J1AEK7_9ROSI|nr:uncharacterized protein LOC110417371 isoform X2 [Herrania umbratica]